MGIADYDPIIRFLHVLSGIVWIGMLYFFNLVNLPLLKVKLTQPYEANMGEKATGPVIVKTLFWFRWGAAFTVLFGLLLIGVESAGGAASGFFTGRGIQSFAIGMGILFALVMAFNVWFVIWPRQKKILGNNKRIAAGVTDDEKKRMEAENAPMVKVATMASRTNTWLSVPMLWGMIFSAHGDATWLATNTGMVASVGSLVLVLLLMFAYSKKKA